MSVVHFPLTQTGAYLVLIGNFIVAGSQLVLPDETPGSLRSLGIALGMLISAVGAFLIARGHTSSPPPVQDVTRAFRDMSQFFELMNKLEKETEPDAQTDQPASKPSQA